MALVAANKQWQAANTKREDGMYYKGGDPVPETWDELVKRDIFDPVGMDSSHFLATEENRDLVVIPSLAPFVVVSSLIQRLALPLFSPFCFTFSHSRC